MKKFFLALAFLSAIVSCKKGEEIENVISQDEKISEWLDKQMASNEDYSSTYKDGAVRLTIVKGSGEALKEGGEVSLSYTLRDFNNGNGNGTLFFSNMGTDSVRICLGEDDILKGLKLGLEGVKAGEQGYIVFPSDLGYGNSRSGMIPANTALMYEIKVNIVENK